MAAKLVVLQSRVVSHETVAALEYLLSQARSGAIVGMAFVALHSGREYSSGVLGHCKHEPTLTLGMIDALAHEARGHR